MSEDLYWRLHALSKMLESSDRIDALEYRDAYPTILDAMNAVRAAPTLPDPGDMPCAKCRKPDLCERRGECQDGAAAAPAQPAEPAAFNNLFDQSKRIAAERDAALKQAAALKLFALDVLKAWPLGDVDGGDLQEMAVKHGLLVPEKRTAPCSEEGCNCAEYYSAEEWAEGITCYRRAEWLSPVEPTRSQKLAAAGFKRRPSWRSLPSDE